MDELTDFLSRMKSGDVPLPSDEAATKLGIVLRILSYLGWNVFDPLEVVPEYSAGPGSVDYCLRYGEDGVFIEVKRPSEDLGSHQEQLLKYAFHEGVDLAVLTNGQTWSFFLPTRKGSWEQRKFCTIDVGQQEPDQAASRFSDFLSKQSVTTGEALRAAQTFLKSKAREEALRNAMPRAWQQMLSEPDESLVELLKERVEKLCSHRADAAAISKFLARMAVPLPPPPPTPPPPSGPPGATGSYIGSKLKAFVFRGTRIEVRRWCHMLVELSRLIYLAHKADFARCLTLRGRKRAHFSKGAPDPSMHGPHKIPGTPFFVETYYNAKDMVKRCHQLMALFGYKESELEITLR